LSSPALDEAATAAPAEPASGPAAAARPILVTGMPRSGTSWVGKMLEASRKAVYINEPLNPQHPPGRSPGVLRATVPHRFLYITEENDQDYDSAFADLFRLRYNVAAELAENRSPVDLLRLLKYLSSFTIGRRRGKKPLLDDPFAVFSAAWLARRFDCSVIVVVRHPAAVAASRRQLSHRTDFSHFLRQPLLMRDWLEPFRAEMETMARTPEDLIGHACLLWRMIYSVVHTQRHDTPALHVVRHEDLSLAPLTGFARLYAQTGLPFDETARRAITRATTARERRSAPAWSLSRGVSRTGFRPLDSRSHVGSWKRMLRPEEIGRVRRLTADVAPAYYASDDWS
jgi:hypothetical protein